MTGLLLKKMVFIPLKNFLLPAGSCTGRYICTKLYCLPKKLLVLILKRARELADCGEELFGTPALKFFLYNKISKDDLAGHGKISSETLVENFIKLDDNDIISSAKIWCDSTDFVLSDLCRRLINRDLFAVELQNDPFAEKSVSALKMLAGNLPGITPELIDYYVFTDCVSNSTYAPDAPKVKILLKSGEIKEISMVSDMFDHKSLSERVTKYFLCYPKECRIKK